MAEEPDNHVLDGAAARRRQFINNFHVLHGRTAYVDDRPTGRVRHPAPGGWRPTSWRHARRTSPAAATGRATARPAASARRRLEARGKLTPAGWARLTGAMAERGQRDDPGGRWCLLEAATSLRGQERRRAGAAAVIAPRAHVGRPAPPACLPPATACPAGLEPALGHDRRPDRRKRTAVGADLLGASLAAIPSSTSPSASTWAAVVLAVIGGVRPRRRDRPRDDAPAAAGTRGWLLERVNGLHEAIWGVAFIVGPGSAASRSPGSAPSTRCG